jgi:F-type H+-transporting ATPase subunit a
MIDLMPMSLLLAKLEVGEHFYWEIAGLKIHGQVFMTSWFVIALLLLFSVLATRKIERIPSGLQNFMEYGTGVHS